MIHREKWRKNAGLLLASSRKKGPQTRQRCAGKLEKTKKMHGNKSFQVNVAMQTILDF